MTRELIKTNMDSECMSLLPGVCEVLTDAGRSLPDDTSLEKLLDWFTGLTQSGGSLLEACPCLLEFVSAVVSNTSPDPGVLSFTLKLAGLMAAAKDGFDMLQECSVLGTVFSIQHWQEAGSWKEPCVRIGWIQGLKNLLQHPKALSFFVQSGFIEPLLQLQTDPSLFVASAVNQTLAHILLFSQPVSSSSINKDDNGWTQTSIHADIVTVISEHLKDSLVPKANTQLQQSLQTLKLLALLLGRAGPPLRVQLLHAVADSLEQLVATGHSPLTLPLMDVILAAYSCGTDENVPDQRVARLLSSMLNTNDPPDLIRTAAAFLHRGLHDTVHTSQAVRGLLLPLEIITGKTLQATDSNADERRSSLLKHLKRKTCCISTICVCLTNTPRITFMPPDLVPCPPGLIVTAVLSLLKICSGVSSSSGCSEVCRNIIGSVKVQKCALEALTAVNSSTGGKEEISDVFTVLTQYLDNPDSDPTVLHKSYQALVKWTSLLTDGSFLTDQLRLDLVQVVRKRVCDVRWEVRDSTLEFLGHLADVRVLLKPAEDTCNASEALLGDCCTTLLMREALQDTESYVRASAISALARTLSCSWQQGAALSKQETEIVSRLLEILSQDTEGFSRRAVVRYFIAWFSSHPSHSSSAAFLKQCVHTVLSRGSEDLDWEVKVHTLELAELLLNEAFSGHQGSSEGSRSRHALSHPYVVLSDQVYTQHSHTGAHTEDVESDVTGAMNNLVEQGVISTLLSGLLDCNRPVALKACHLLIRLRDTVCPSGRGPPAAAEVSCKLPAGEWGWEIRRILGMKKSCGASEEDLVAQRSFNGADYSGNCDVLREGGDGVTVGVCEVLDSLDLDERLDVLTQSSDHIHNSPLSLLQDILAAPVAHCRSDAQPGQEVIVDCY